MRLLFVNGRSPYPFHIGGDGVSIHEILDYLHDAKFETRVIGTINPKRAKFDQISMLRKLKKMDIDPDFSFNEEEIRFSQGGIYSPRSKHHLRFNIPYRVDMVDTRNFFKYTRKILNKYKPDIVFTQIDFSPEVIIMSQDRRIPVFYFVHDAFYENMYSFDAIDEERKLTYIIFNSEFTRSQYLQQNQYIRDNSFILYPPLQEAHYAVENDGKFITIVNPLKHKGGEVFLKIVKAMPDKHFLAVKGWKDPEDEGIRLEDPKNLLVMGYGQDMKEVYKKTRILLLPSMYDEAFGRVAPEAGISGIPTIGTARGGIPESVGEGGILIENPNDIETWVEAINLLDNEDTYQRYSNAAKENAKKFTMSNQGRTLTRYIIDVIESL